MHKIIFSAILIILLGCSNQPEQSNNRLNGDLIKITEYLISVKLDSLCNPILDTLTITDKFYDKQNQIIKRVQANQYNEDSMVIDFKYDLRNRLKKEIVQLIHDSIEFTVNYFYKSSRLHETQSEFENAEFKSIQKNNYNYTKDNVLTESSSTHLIVEFDTNDTTLNQLEKNKYNDKKEVIETVISDFVNPNKNRKYFYNYSNTRLNERLEYNLQDSLICKTLYKYELDKFQNWIEKQSYDDGELVFITKREIKYK